MGVKLRSTDVLVKDGGDSGEGKPAAVRVFDNSVTGHNTIRIPQPLIYVGVDGTGPDEDEVTWDGKNKYEVAFRRSFVKTLYHRVPGPYRYYLRGAEKWGWDTKNESDETVALVRLCIKDYTAKCLAATPKPVVVKLPGSESRQITMANRLAMSPRIKVCLAGYSRGAAAVIDAARRLEADGIKIDTLILFDPVDLASSGQGVTQDVLKVVMPMYVWGTLVARDSDRHINAKKIPGNVQKAFRMTRSRLTGSREVMGNCATEFDRSVVEAKSFITTHGGMGGTPWCTDPDFKRRFRWSPDESGAYDPPEWDEKIQEVVRGCLDDKLYYSWQLVKYAAMATANPFGSPVVLARVRAEAEAEVQIQTKITFREDLEGSKKVWEWIAPRLMQLEIIQNDEWPGADLRECLRQGRD